MVRKRHNKLKKRGKEKRIVCSACGGLVEKSKAKRVVRSYNITDPTIRKELQQQGSILHKFRKEEYYCVKCAIHIGIVKVGDLHYSRLREKEKPKANKIPKKKIWDIRKLHTMTPEQFQNLTKHEILNYLKALKRYHEKKVKGNEA